MTLTIIETIQITSTIIPITFRMFTIAPAGYGIGA